MSFHIVGSKTELSGHLCRKCKLSTLTTFHNGNELWRCNRFGMFIKSPVASCQGFYANEEMDITHLKELAYMIDKDDDGEILISKDRRLVNKNPKRKRRNLNVTRVARRRRESTIEEMMPVVIKTGSIN